MGDLVAALGPAVERLPLTDRECEIVVLIRNGLTSRDQLAGQMPGTPNAVPPS
jgi:DNA-binding CsgD family transcriptional regulator